MINAVQIHDQQEAKIIPSNDAPMVAMIERIVMDPNIPIDRLVHRLNPEGFIEFQLRQTVNDAIKELGREKVMEIVEEAAE